jgi:predicted dehydrogenase
MIRVAVLGGGIGAQHLAAYATLPEFQVTMLVDHDQTRLDTLATGAIRAETDIDAALGSDVDIIDICLPPHLHAPITIAALKAGKNVICEKPLATSLAQIDAIRRAADAAKRQVFPVFQYRFGPALTQLQALRDAGLTGAPRAAALETHWNRGADYYAVPWRGTWAGEQGGAILGHAIHSHDLLRHFMAPITGVTARLGTLINPIETEDTAALIFDLAGGGMATSSVTLGSARDESRVRLVYEHLTATSDTVPYAPAEGAWQFVARDAAAQVAVDRVLAHTKPGLSGFPSFLSEVALSLSGQPNRAVTFEDGAASIALVTAIYHAHRTGQSVTLPLGPDHPLQHGWQS